MQTKMPMVRTVPIKTHKKRRNQSIAYHLRVQKKWQKRYGTRTERYALMVNPEMLGLGLPGNTLFVDASMMQILRNF